MRATLKSPKPTLFNLTEVLDRTTTGAIAQNLALLGVAPARSARVKAALIARISTEKAAPISAATSATSAPVTTKNISTRHAFSDDITAKWRPINPLVSMQVLHDDGETLSWYARFQPGGRLPAHDHTGDEESLVISGSCYLNDKLMQIGDYQICRAGSRHDNVFSEHGCLLFIRTPKAMLRNHAHA